ncbi:MAG: hypothetical protein IRY86_10140 [Thermorudis peleae]|nr:hypothetical protein [Thermorudis peleae]
MVVMSPARRVLAALAAARTDEDVLAAVQEYLAAIGASVPRMPPEEDERATWVEVSGLPPEVALLAALIRDTVTECQAGDPAACRWIQARARAWLALLLDEPVLTNTVCRLAALAGVEHRDDLTKGGKR